MTDLDSIDYAIQDDIFDSVLKRTICKAKTLFMIHKIENWYYLNVENN